MGLVVETTDFQLSQGRLYAARRKAADPALNILQIRRSPLGNENEIWIVKETVEIRKEPSDAET